MQSVNDLASCQILERSQWRQWRNEDYLKHFLSRKASNARANRRAGMVSRISDADLMDFCQPVRDRIQSQLRAEMPRISLVLRAYNEEFELLPTLVSYAFGLQIPAPCELIVVNNNSSDRTSLLIEAAGAKCVDCKTPGIGHATKAGYNAISPSSEYVLISDADVRPTCPFESYRRFQPATFLTTSYRVLESRPQAMGVSTGTMIESAHWSYWLMRRFSTGVLGASEISYWAGTNQFIRRSALDGVGGINEKVEYGHGEDHARQYQLARWCKLRGFDLLSGSQERALRDPNFHSGRRVRSLGLVLRHAWLSFRQPKRKMGPDGWPLFEEEGQIEKCNVR